MGEGGRGDDIHFYSSGPQKYCQIKQEQHGSGSWEFLKITVLMLLLGSVISTEILVFLIRIWSSFEVSQWLREPVAVTSEE